MVKLDSAISHVRGSVLKEPVYLNPAKALVTVLETASSTLSLLRRKLDLHPRPPLLLLRHAPRRSRKREFPLREPPIPRQDTVRSDQTPRGAPPQHRDGGTVERCAR